MFLLCRHLLLPKMRRVGCQTAMACPGSTVCHAGRNGMCGLPARAVLHRCHPPPPGTSTARAEAVDVIESIPMSDRNLVGVVRRTVTVMAVFPSAVTLPCTPGTEARYARAAVIAADWLTATLPVA